MGEGLTTRLAAMIADLDGYINRRAAEKAKPLVDAVAADAAERITAAEHETGRQAGLTAELRRQLKARDREAARWREIAEGKAADLIVRCDEVREGDRILDAAGSLVAVLGVDVYDDHLGIDVRDGEGRWHLDRQPDALTAVRRVVADAGCDICGNLRAVGDVRRICVGGEWVSECATCRAAAEGPEVSS
jgi:hypothetical protein